jgi:dienelactone hydrolase
MAVVRADHRNHAVTMKRTTVLGIAGALALGCAAPAGAFAQERVQFPSTDSALTGGAPTELDGYLFRPEGPGPFPAVVAMHGCNGVFAPRRRVFAVRHTDWGERLARLGYLVLFPDSFSPRGVRGLCRRELVVRPGVHRVHDAYGTLAYLRRRGDVRPDAIAMLGWSQGAIATLWASWVATRARPHPVEHDFAAGIAVYPGCAAIAERPYRPAFPVHLFVGELDDWTPAAPCKTFAEKFNLPLVAYPNAYHGFDAPNVKKMVLTGIRATKSHTATIGTDPEARADLLKRVPEILAGIAR